MCAYIKPNKQKPEKHTQEIREPSYMKYKCNDETLKGIERAAFHLHCSARQLQRILNQIEAAGLVKKLKGHIS